MSLTDPSSFGLVLANLKGVSLASPPAVLDLQICAQNQKNNSKKRYFLAAIKQPKVTNFGFKVFVVESLQR
jgi:hypothetical protein